MNRQRLARASIAPATDWLAASAIASYTSTLRAEARHVCASAA